MAPQGSNVSSSRSKLFLCLLLLACTGAAGLQVGFYQQSCPDAESIVRNVTWAGAAADPSLAGKLLRVYFHDCFPQGCDASVLLDGRGTEKAAGPNLSLGGLDVVDAAKAALEVACPGTVSCADVVALAARDAVSFQFGRLLWEVETGRRDSCFSDEADATSLPNPEFVFPILKDSFAKRGLGVADLVALSGAHTLGRTTCMFVSPRLYTFRGNGGVDPLIDPGYARELMQQCQSTSSTNRVVMDPGSEFSFDTSYYAAVKANRGVLLTDSVLMHDDEAARLVDEMQDQGKFLAAFEASIRRMGAIGVLTGSAGEIRRNCRVVN
ncbi:Cationic peroxidase 2 [Dichanthelium oligosanthes]|uniref:Peroxidase n=1 Tax=Dichanthelium oligosanthes TaxID=888268 RepID=A0A1E5WB54_9POAL|nr:Cationic peroxidase 2 [Dichanthelium oligosanthes]